MIMYLAVSVVTEAIIDLKAIGGNIWYLTEFGSCWLIIC